MRLIDADEFKKQLSAMAIKENLNIQKVSAMINLIDSQPTAYDVELEIRLLKNYLSNMPKVYRFRNQNWVVVRDLLMTGTSHAGQTSCIMKCRELGIDPYGYDLKGVVKDE